jgi:hypothetical protein
VAERVKELTERIDRMQKRIENAKGQGKKAQPGRKALEEHLAEARIQLRSLQPQSSSKPKPADWDHLIRLAYLRSLSRPPTSSEIESVQGYLKGSTGGPATGLRGLLWALLNTKEFMTNH